MSRFTVASDIRVTFVLLLGVLVLQGCSARGSRPAGPLTDAIVRHLGPPTSSSKFEGAFEARLSEASPRESFRALVDLTEQVDLAALGRFEHLHDSSPSRRRNAVLSALERVAERQQSKLKPVLDRLARDGSLDHWTPVAIVNRIVVEGRASAILALGASPEVARVLPDWESGRRVSGKEADAEASGPLGERFTSWAIPALGTEKLWGQGLDGSGVVVASIDTGADEAHEQLAGRRLPGERGWFDPVNGSSIASDGNGHGTGVLSQAVGGNPAGRIVGIAPGARWASALGNLGNRYSRFRMTLAADWVLRVARPDVLVNAWSHDEEPCTSFDLDFINAWRASGIFVVYPAGNAGPAPRSGESPAQLAGAWPDGRSVFSVAAVSPSGEVLDLSSRGPSRCGASDFPSLAAPGADLPHATPGAPRSYAVGSGTSFAAGLVGGAAALLLQADPDLPPEDLERILVETSRDLPPPGRDDSSGAGALDLVAALDRVRSNRASRASAAPR